MCARRQRFEDVPFLEREPVVRADRRQRVAGQHRQLHDLVALHVDGIEGAERLQVDRVEHGARGRYESGAEDGFQRMIDRIRR